MSPKSRVTDPMRHHVGRSFTGHRLEDQCPCPKEPCGLIDTRKAVGECTEHTFWAAKTIRQAHPAYLCPALAESIEVITLGEDSDQWMAIGTSDAHSAEMAVRSHFRNEVGESVEEYASTPVDFGFIYRTDWAWVKVEGADYDEILVHGGQGRGNSRFHGFMVTL